MTKSRERCPPIASAAYAAALRCGACEEWENGACRCWGPSKPKSACKKLWTGSSPYRGSLGPCLPVPTSTARACSRRVCCCRGRSREWPRRACRSRGLDALSSFGRPSGSNFCRINRDVSCVHTASIIAVLEDRVCFALTKQDKIRDTIFYCDIEHVEELDGEDALGGGGPSRAFSHVTSQSFSKKKSARREAVTMRHEHERSREGTSFRIFDVTHHRNYFFRCVRLEPWRTTGSRCLLSPSITTGWKVRTSERPLSKRFAPQWMNAGGRRSWPRISTLLNERVLGALR